MYSASHYFRIPKLSNMGSSSPRGAFRRVVGFVTAISMVVLMLVLGAKTPVRATSWSAVTVTGLGASKQIVDVDVSGDGQVVAVVGQYDYVYVSTNGGSTWSKPASVNTSTRDWVGVDVSHDGSRIVAAYNGYLSPNAGDGGVWISTNSGSTWSDVSPNDGMSSYFRLSDIAMSDDGTKMIACGDVYNSSNTGYVWVSTNSGATWGTGGSARKYFRGCTMDADGSVMYAAGNGQMGSSGGGVFKSTDYGASWTTHLPSGTTTDNSMWFVATDSTGTNVMASVYGSSTKIYSSVNSGSTWTASSGTFSSVRRVFVSRDGSTLFATHTGGIITSGDGVSYSSTTISGSSVFSSFAASADLSKVWATHYSSGVFSNSSFSVDFTPPTASWTAPSSPSSSRTLSYLLTFSEAVSGIAGSDFSNTGTATGCVFAPAAAAGTTVTISVTCSSDGTLVARLSANSVLDASSNTGPVSAVSASSVTIDTTVSTTTTAAPTTTTTTTSTTVASTNTSTSVAPTGTTTAPSNTISSSNTTSPSPVTAPPTTSKTVVAPASTSIPAGGAVSNNSTTTSSTTTTSTLAPIKFPEVTDSGAALMLDGERVEATVSRENNQMVLTAGPITARISAVNPEGDRAPLDSDGRVRLMSGDSIEVDVTGFGASSSVEVRLYSDPVLLGRSTVGTDGKLAASYEVPTKVDDGRHTVVLLGQSDTAEEITFSLAVMVGDEVDGSAPIALLFGVPLLLAIVGALLLPALIRRRRTVEM